MAKKKELKKEQLEKVSGGYYKTTTATYERGLGVDAAYTSYENEAVLSHGYSGKQTRIINSKNGKVIYNVLTSKTMLSKNSLSTLKHAKYKLNYPIENATNDDDDFVK